MNCPKCNVPLSMSERQSVEIDFCPQCRGVWLDRGELDKIIERAAQLMSPQTSRPVGGPPPLPPEQAGQHRQSRREYDDDDDDDDDDYRGAPGQGKKRRGFLGDLFD